METKTSQSPLNAECEQLEVLLPAYVLGATDADETRLVETLLRRCPDYAADLRDFAALAEGLVYSAPAMLPPAALHDQIMAAARATSPQAEPTLRALPRPGSTPVSRPSRITPIIAAVSSIAAALLLVGNLFWISQLNAARITEQEVRALIAQRDDALVTLTGGGELQRAQLVSTDDNAPFANVLYASNFRTGIIIGENLPALRAGQTFQLWLIDADSAPISMGVFQPDDDNTAVYVFEAQSPVGDFDVIGVSIEPEGGSPQPTMNPIAAASL